MEGVPDRYLKCLSAILSVGNRLDSPRPGYISLPVQKGNLDRMVTGRGMT
jgi:hypothetical protein